MSNKINDGGPAFPCLYAPPGMKLRDYFAAAALTGFLANMESCRTVASDVSDTVHGRPSRIEGTRALPVFTDEVSRICYDFADAMLKERDLAHPT